MTAATSDRTTPLGRALDWIKARLAQDSELATLSRFDLDYMAADLGITEADLRDVLPRAADNSLLMDTMMRARGLDPAVVRASCAALMRDLELTCTRCGAATRCRNELAEGTAVAHCHEYCGNAETFAALLAD